MLPDLTTVLAEKKAEFRHLRSAVPQHLRPYDHISDDDLEQLLGTIYLIEHSGDLSAFFTFIQFINQPRGAAIPANTLGPDLTKVAG